MSGAALLLTDDAEQGEAFILADDSQLDQRSMILSDPNQPGRLLLVNTAEFMAHHSVTIDGKRQTTGKPQPRRRFSRKGKR
jgi:hypothetical protein